VKVTQKERYGALVHKSTSRTQEHIRTDKGNPSLTKKIRKGVLDQSSPHDNIDPRAGPCFHSLSTYHHRHSTPAVQVPVPYQLFRPYFQRINNNPHALRSDGLTLSSVLESLHAGQDLIGARGCSPTPFFPLVKGYPSSRFPWSLSGEREPSSFPIPMLVVSSR